MNNIVSEYMREHKFIFPKQQYMHKDYPASSEIHVQVSFLFPGIIDPKVNLSNLRALF